MLDAVSLNNEQPINIKLTFHKIMMIKSNSKSPPIIDTMMTHQGTDLCLDIGSSGLAEVVT